MNKSIILSVAAIAALCVLSCQKESNGFVPEVTPEIVNNKEATHNPDFVPTVSMKFKGITDNEINTGTKTSIDGTTIKWAAHDGIYLFDGVAPRAFASDNDAVATTVDFEGSASAVAKYYAIYPSGKLSTVTEKKVITTTIPTFQTATANSFAPKANVAVAYSTDDLHAGGSLQFKNIAAVVKFKIHEDNDDVRKVRLDALNGEDMSGKATVTFESDGSFNTASVHANSESCVILESESDLVPSKTYYMAIKPGTYEGGFKITLVRNDGSYRSIKNTTSNTLERNDLMDFGTLPSISSWKEGTIDVLTRETTGVTDGSTTYTAWSNKAATSDARYAGKSAGGKNSIQLRSSGSEEGVVQTTSGGKVTKVVVDWHSDTMDGRTLNIYGKNAEYTAATDLFATATQGTLLGTIVKGTSTELTISGDYTYIGMRSNDGAMYLKSISITTGDAAPADPVKTTQTTSITGLSSSVVSLTDGEATFTVESNGPWTIATNHPEYTSVSVDETDEVTVTFEDGASERNATITVTPAEGEAKTVTITQKDADTYSKYTSALTEGDYIFVGSNDHAMKNVISSGRTTYETVTITNNQISDPSAAIVWHVSQSGDYWQIYNEDQDVYLAGVQNTKNKAALINPSTDYSLWSATVASNEFNFENKGRASDKTDAANKFLRSNGSSGFACYGTSTGTKITLYKKD